MSTRRVGAVVALVLGLAGCTHSPDPVPNATPLPTAAPTAGAAMCGIDPASGEVATGYAMESADSAVPAPSVWCDIDAPGWAGSSALIGVRIDPLDSDEGRQFVGQMHGEIQLPPDVVYEGHVGGAWAGAVGTADPRGAGEQWRLGGTASVLFGDEIVSVLLGDSATGRDTSADLYALTLQVAASLDLGDPTSVP